MRQGAGRQDVFRQRTVFPPKERPAPISLPPEFVVFRYEYDSPVIWMPPPPAVWTFDFSFANRGTVEQKFFIMLTEFHFAVDQPTQVVDPLPSLPGRIFLVNWAIELLGSGDSAGWWARMFTSSLDVIPSLHVHADTPDPGTDPPHFPDFYFSPGDFARFDVALGYRPPPIVSQ